MFALLLMTLVIIKWAALVMPELIEGTDYETSVIKGVYNENITVVVDRNSECVVHFPDSNSSHPYTVFAWSEKADVDYPVFVMVRQQKEATSWEIPLLVKSNQGTLRFYKTSRTLCHNNMNILSSHRSQDLDPPKILKRLSMSLSTSSNVSTSVTIRAVEQEIFFVEVDRNYSFTISPSQPRFFYYKYPDRVKHFLGTVILEVDSQDITCLTVSIQNATCPVFDLNEDISYEGEFETVDTRGGIIINEKDYINGFFIVFVAKGDDSDCIRKDSITPMSDFPVVKPLNRSSAVSFKITPDITSDKYWVACLTILLGIGGFYFVFIASSYAFYCWENRPSTDNPAVPSDDLEGLLSNEGSEGNESPSVTPDGVPASTSGDFTPVVVPEQVIASTSGNQEARMGPNCPSEINVSSETGRETFHSCIEDNYEIINYNNCFEEIDQKLRSPTLYLDQLATKNPREVRKESCNYLWQVLSVGIFYAVPVVQLAITQEQILHESGNLDICYYNFLCAHPLSSLNDFNHVYSNIGYVAAGILFFFYTFYRQRHTRQEENCGIPQHYGLYYAMSAALIMEGVLSACYHICPNRSNFQFDTSFMYVMAVLCIVKLYQNRHPDINATAYVTFVLLAAAVLIAVVGILDGNFIIWAVFICGYIVLFARLAVYVYFLHYPARGLFLVKEVRKTSGILAAMKPIKKERCILLVMATIANTTGALLGFPFRNNGGDFATFQLALLMGNVILYIIMYIAMKAVNREVISLQSVVYTILTMVTWVAAGYFFIMHSSEWGLTPAKSRERNTHCVVLDFYDYHDLWHLFSAAALFFSFIVLSTLDDRLGDKPRNRIEVF